MPCATRVGVLDLAVRLPNTAHHTYQGKVPMTQSGYPDPNANPQYGQPDPGDSSGGYGQPAQPGYGQPAQPGYGAQGGYPSAPPTGYGAAAPQNRPGMVTAAAVLAFVSGGLGLLGNLLAFSLIGSFGVPGFLVVLAVVGLLLSIGLIYGGLLTLQGKSFVILLVLAGAAILLNLISMITYFQVTSLLSFVIPVLIIIFLMNPQSKAWIKSRGGATLG